MKVLTVRIPDEMHEALRKESYGSRRSMNEIVLDALNEFRQAAFVPTPMKKEP